MLVEYGSTGMSTRRHIMLSQSGSLRFCSAPDNTRFDIITVKLVVRLYRSYGTGAGMWLHLLLQAFSVQIRKPNVTFATLGMPAPRQSI